MNISWILNKGKLSIQYSNPIKLSKNLSTEIGDEFDLKRHISYRELRF